MKRLLNIIICSILIVFMPGKARSYSLVSGDTGAYGYGVDLDAYYTYAEFYVPFEKKKELILATGEAKMYKVMFQRSIIPKFFLAEASVYPMPNLGVYIRRNHAGFYTSAKFSERINLISSLCAGFEEPWAVSVLLGNVVDFKRQDNIQGCTGKAYLGYLASFGTYHIRDSVLIKDNWIELEWKIKGDRITPENSVSWSFRTGGKIHGNEYISDVVYISIRRERVDYAFKGFSLVRNTSLEYRMDFSAGSWSVASTYFLLGKNFPLKNKNVFQITLGFIKEGRDKYTGPLEREEDWYDILYILRPNFKF